MSAFSMYKLFFDRSSEIKLLNPKKAVWSKSRITFWLKFKVAKELYVENKYGSMHEIPF